MLMFKERRPAIRTLRGYAISPTKGGMTAWALWLRRSPKQQRVGRRGQSISPWSFRGDAKHRTAISRFRVWCYAPCRNDSGGWGANVYTTRRAGTIAIEAFTNIHSENVPMNSSAAKTFLICHGAWSAGWAGKKMHPLMQGAGHRLVTPTYTGLGERVHLANPSIDLEIHIQDVLNVIKYEDLRDIVLLGHLWRHGGDRRRRSCPRSNYAIDLSRCLRTARRAVTIRRQRTQAAAHAGRRQEGRRLARSADDAAAGHIARRPRMAHRAPRRHADQMF
jgi:hypothetical protein